MNINLFHQQFVEYLDRLGARDLSRESVEKALGEFLNGKNILCGGEREEARQGVISRMWGFSILDVLFADEEISEIMDWTIYCYF